MREGNRVGYIQMKLWKRGDKQEDRTYRILVHRIEGGHKLVEKAGYIPVNAPEMSTKGLVEKIKEKLIL